MHLPLDGAAALAPRAGRGRLGGERAIRARVALIGPEGALRDHPGFDKVVLLAVSPQVLEGRILIGTVDPEGILGVEGATPPGQVQRLHRGLRSHGPDRFIGYASVNPASRGAAGGGGRVGAGGP